MTYDASLRPTDLMPLINIAWDKSFARNHQNKKAIVDRGWNHLNYNLLTEPDLRATMTIGEKVSEHSKITLPPSMQPENINNSDSNQTSSDNSTASKITTSHSSQKTSYSQQSSLNFSTGVSAECLTALVRNEQLMEARERIWKEKGNGEDLTTRLKQAKHVTAGSVWKEGTNRLGKTIFEVCKEKQLLKRKKQRDKVQKRKESLLRIEGES